MRAGEVMSEQFVWPSDSDRAENDELNRVCEYAEQLHDELQAIRSQQPNLSSIAQKKLDQMGATVHGVLVKNEAGAWAAVSDAGRVMWLDGFEGQAARAQQAGSGEAVMEYHNSPSGMHVVWETLPYGKHLLYTHSQPAQQEIERWKTVAHDQAETISELQGLVHECKGAQQESVPEGWRVARANHSAKAIGTEAKGFLIQSPRVNGVAANTAVWEDSENPAERLLYLMLSTTPQPEGDGWIKCSERLPTEADADDNGEVWWLTPNEKGEMSVISMHWSFASPSDRGITLLDEATHWKPTGLKRPTPPAEKEGE